MKTEKMNVISMQRSQRLILLILGSFVIVIIYVGFFRTSSLESSQLSDIDFDVVGLHADPRERKLTLADLSPSWTLRPDFVELHTVDTNGSSARTAPLIPHIVHQIWDTSEVPRMYVKWMETWTQRNPRWQHWLWTLSDIRQLVERHYNDQLTLYDSYESAVFRADAGRYFILHRYGGVYVDLDMDSLRPLDAWSRAGFSCLVSEENYEHSFIVREQNHTNVMNGFIAAAPRHSFLDVVIRSLDDAARRYFGDYLYATGPAFFDSALRRYAATSPPPAARVTVLPPVYFLPSYDPSESDIISGKCFPTRLRSLPAAAQLVCRHLASRNFRNDVDALAYANHHWIHAYMFDDAWKRADAVNVFDAIKRLRPAATASDHFA